MASLSKDRSYLWGSLAADLLAGGVCLVLIIAFTMPLGGFSFFEPWLIVTPVVMFLTGILLGGTFGNIWIRAVAISIPGWLLTVVMASGSTVVESAESKFVGMLMFAAPTALGIWLRRRRTRAVQSKVDIKN